MKASLIWLILALMAAAGAHADEKAVPLKEAPGQPAVEENCASCHSLDYLRTNSPFLDRKGWQAEVLIFEIRKPARPVALAPNRPIG